MISSLLCQRLERGKKIRVDLGHLTHSFRRLDRDAANRWEFTAFGCPGWVSHFAGTEASYSAQNSSNAVGTARASSGAFKWPKVTLRDA